MRLIDADALIEKIEMTYCYACKGTEWEDCQQCGYAECLEMLKNADTVSTVNVTQNGNNCVSIQNCGVMNL